MEYGICDLELKDGQLCICDTCKNILASSRSLIAF